MRPQLAHPEPVQRPRTGGDAAGAYGTAAAADDMATILEALDVPKVDIYSFAQPLTLVLHRTQFVEDMWVSGKAIWQRRRARVRVLLRVAGPSGTRGWLHISFPVGGHSRARVRGRLEGRPCA